MLEIETVSGNVRDLEEDRFVVPPLQCAMKIRGFDLGFGELRSFPNLRSTNSGLNCGFTLRIYTADLQCKTFNSADLQCKVADLQCKPFNFCGFTM